MKFAIGILYARFDSGPIKKFKKKNYFLLTAKNAWNFPFLIGLSRLDQLNSSAYIGSAIGLHRLGDRLGNRLVGLTN
jgi:hypothetical protein